MDKRRRFRCGNSSICLEPEQICNGIRDCPISDFEDEHVSCPWSGTYFEEDYVGFDFVCRDHSEIEEYKVCNTVRDCPGGEDELWCNLSDPPWKLDFNGRLLSDIVVYPSIPENQSQTIKQFIDVEPSKDQR